MQVIALAKAAMADGEYRWASDLLNHVIFADPKNPIARGLLADSYEQQGYQAESGIWRNMFLSAAKELREGKSPSLATQPVDLIKAIPTGQLLDAVATRLNPAKIGAGNNTLNLNFTDRKEKALLSIGNAVMVTEMGEADAAPAATLSGPRILFLGTVVPESTARADGSCGAKSGG